MPTSPTDGTEHVALARHGCAACGAEAEWNPSAQALVCPHCGTKAPVELDRDTGNVREIDLVRTLRELGGEQRGWATEKRTVRCRSCRAVSVFDPERVGQSCAFCGSTELVDYDEIRAPLRPESVLPFRVAEDAVREQMRRWYAGKWLAPGNFKKRASVEEVNGIYLPYWTFDAQVFCRWTAESGTYFYETESYRDDHGRVRTRRVRHIRWRPMRGLIEHFFDDQPVPGTRTVDPALLARIGPFPTQELVPYDTAYLSGFVVEHYRVVLVDAARQARRSMDEQLRLLCARDVPGDTHRDLEIDPEYSGRTFKHILVPVWLLPYRYGSKTYPLLANGATGKMAGRYPRSPWKIASVIALAAAALLLLLRLLGG